MDKKLNSDNDDILGESYKGAGAAVTAAGEGYIAHFVYAVVGLIGGGALSFVFHKPVNKFILNWRESGMNAVESANRIKRGYGYFTQFLVGHREGTFESAKAAVESVLHDNKIRTQVVEAIENKQGGFIHWMAGPLRKAISGASKFGKPSTDEVLAAARADAAALGGGLLGAFGFLFSPFIVAPGAAVRAMRGRKQFERLKTEVADLRTQNDEWKDRYVEAKLALEKATQHRGSNEDNLVVAPDQPPEMQSAPSEEGLASLDASEAKPPHREAPKPTLDAAHAAHHGKLHHDHTREVAHA